MLDPWIIEEIRKREDRQRRDEQPEIWVPLEEPEADDQVAPREEKPERGVVIVDFRI